MAHDSVASAFRRTVTASRRKIILVILLLVCARAANADVIDRIMAVVGGQPITLSDVNAARLFRLADVPAGTSDPIGYALDRLIERTLILSEVERFQPPEPDPIEITIRIDEIERRFGSPAAFDTALAVTGTTRDQLRRYLRDDLRITTYLNQRFGASTDPAERRTAITTWLAELRKRADVTMLYLAK
jgi:hypothetical protein